MMHKSSLVQYAYALDDEGILVHIDDALRSNTYICPGCKSPLTPILGKIKAQHYRHTSECCPLETYLHKSAKEAFFYRYKQAVSNEEPISLELKRLVTCNGPRLLLAREEAHRCQKHVPARYDLLQFFDQAELEKYDKLTGLRPDVMLYDTTSERRCYIEICVTHPCSQEKIESGVPIIEFNIQSVEDIKMLLEGSYSIKNEIMRVFNWLPPSQVVDTCSGICDLGDLDMTVWSLGDSGRLYEQSMQLCDVDLTINSELSTWPNSILNAELEDNLKAFIRHADPYSLFPNCIMCEHARRWSDGYLECRSKEKTVPYTEARQCVSYKVKR